MILIDMEMPEKCGLCPLFHAEHPMHCQGVKADRKKKIVAPYGQPRPDWCPLHDVDDMPMVSAERTGKWSNPFNMGTYKYRCSGCKKLSRAMYDFCPNCGARMVTE